MLIAGDATVAAAAQQRMLQVCRQVITRAAQDTWQHSGGQDVRAGATHHIADGTSWDQVSFHAVFRTVPTKAYINTVLIV